MIEHEDPDSPTISRQAHWVPPEIWEIVIAHLAYDSWTLKACAATCFTWYNIATPHLHRTLKFRQWARDTTRVHLNPLEFLHKLDLLKFVKEVQFEKAMFGTPWLVPAIFDPESLQYFCELKNLQDLTIADLDFSHFPMGVGKYWGHFSPTLRSMALISPRGTRRQLLDFMRLFPKLDHVKISNYRGGGGEYKAVGTPLVPTEGGLRGGLTLKNFGDEGLLKDMAVVYGGMRFSFMDLDDVQGVRFVLETCADTLEAVRIHPRQHCKSILCPLEYFVER